jgi:hypothetical protein
MRGHTVQAKREFENFPCRLLVPGALRGNHMIEKRMNAGCSNFDLLRFFKAVGDHGE